jgi:hypothetical protein
MVCNCDDGTITVYDSLIGESKFEKVPVPNNISNYLRTIADIKWDNVFKDAPSTIPKQTDSINCGIFVIAYVEAFLYNGSVPSVGTHPSYWEGVVLRKRIKEMIDQQITARGGHLPLVDLSEEEEEEEEEVPEVPKVPKVMEVPKVPTIGVVVEGLKKKTTTTTIEEMEALYEGLKTEVNEFNQDEREGIVLGTRLQALRSQATRRAVASANDKALYDRFNKIAKDIGTKMEKDTLHYTLWKKVAPRKDPKDSAGPRGASKEDRDFLVAKNEGIALLKEGIEGFENELNELRRGIIMTPVTRIKLADELTRKVNAFVKENKKPIDKKRLDGMIKRGVDTQEYNTNIADVNERIKRLRSGIVQSKKAPQETIEEEEEEEGGQDDIDARSEEGSSSEEGDRESSSEEGEWEDSAVDDIIMQKNIDNILAHVKNPATVELTPAQKIIYEEARVNVDAVIDGEKALNQLSPFEKSILSAIPK